jgi:hypothetical protein
VHEAQQGNWPETHTRASRCRALGRNLGLGWKPAWLTVAVHLIGRRPWVSPDQKPGGRPAPPNPSAFLSPPHSLSSWPRRAAAACGGRRKAAAPPQAPRVSVRCRAALRQRPKRAHAAPRSTGELAARRTMVVAMAAEEHR